MPSGDTQPSDGGRTLERGELTEIIIGAVVAAGAQGIRAGELARKLESWGIKTTPKRTAMILGNLARQGRIDRIRRGLYEGV